MTEFRFIESSLGVLDANKIARLVGATVDLTLVLDPQGLIKQAISLDPDLARLARAHWSGHVWSETATVESRPKIAQIIAESNADTPTRWREINQITDGSDEVPLRVSALRFPDAGLIVVMAYDLRPVARLQQKLVNAQRDLERDYQKLRDAETRYRLLFQITSEAVLIVDGQNNKVTDANPSAALVLETTPGRIVGRSLTDLVKSESRDALQNLVIAVKASRRAEAVRVHVEGASKPFLAACAAIRGDDGISLMVRLVPVETGQHPAGAAPSSLAVLGAMPDGFVLAGADRKIIDVNDAFLDMARLGHRDEAIGTSLEQWLGRTAVEGQVLLAHLRDHGQVRGFALALRGTLGSVEDVDVSAVSVSEGGATYFGFMFHRAKRSEPGSGQALARSAADFADLVGRLSLKGIVRETTDVIEKLCIEAALKLTDDNRASAAQMLGLSRQSLYSKMHRHGIGNLDGPDAPDDV